MGNLVYLYNCTNIDRELPEYRYCGKFVLPAHGKKSIEEKMIKFYKPYRTIGIAIVCEESAKVAVEPKEEKAEEVQSVEPKAEEKVEVSEAKVEEVKAEPKKAEEVKTVEPKKVVAKRGPRSKVTK